MRSFPLLSLQVSCIITSANGLLHGVWGTNTWDTVPTFAFPGCSSVFMNESQAAYFANGFSNLLIWGVNATCLRSDGTTFPPDCQQSTCYCNKSDPESQTWVLNMESSLAAQSAAIKAASTSGRPLPILGYIEGLSAQQYYVAQSEFMHNQRCVELKAAF